MRHSRNLEVEIIFKNFIKLKWASNETCHKRLCDMILHIINFILKYKFNDVIYINFYKKFLILIVLKIDMPLE